jgi:hypothetical protein
MTPFSDLMSIGWRNQSHKSSVRRFFSKKKVSEFLEVVESGPFEGYPSVDRCVQRGLENRSIGKDNLRALTDYILYLKQTSAQSVCLRSCHIL